MTYLIIGQGNLDSAAVQTPRARVYIATVSTGGDVIRVVEDKLSWDLVIFGGNLKFLDVFGDCSKDGDRQGTEGPHFEPFDVGEEPHFGRPKRHLVYP